MKHVTWLAAALVAALAFSSIFAPTARAEGGGGIDEWRYWEYLPGTLQAEGAHGLAAVAGKLEARLCAEDGLLLVKKGEAEISVESHGDTVEWLGLHVYFDFAGCAELGGRGVAALVVGTGIQADAAGWGFAYLAGDGSYSLNGGEPLPWGDGTFVKIKGAHVEPEPDAPKEEEPPVDCMCH